MSNQRHPACQRCLGTGKNLVHQQPCVPCQGTGREPMTVVDTRADAVLSEVVKWALAGHISEMGVTVEAGNAIQAVVVAC